MNPQFIITFTLLLSSLMLTPAAYALNVKCTDPQTERGKVRVQRETTRFQNGEVIERDKTEFEFQGRKIIAPNVKERGEDYEPKPIKKGSNFHECIN